MQIGVDTRDPLRAEADLLALLLPALEPARWRLPARVAALDRTQGGRIAAVIAQRDFRGRPGETLLLYPDGKLGTPRLLLVGLGPEAQIGPQTLRLAAGAAVQAASARGAERVAIVVPTARALRGGPAGQALAEGALLGGFRSDAYRTEWDEEPIPVRQVTLLVERAPDARAARAGAARGRVLGEAQNLARQLSNEPGNALPPAGLARAAERVAREEGLACRVLEVPQLRRLKMGALLAVGQGSRNPPRLVVLEHNAPPRARRGRARRAPRRRPTVCVIGKGITFDSGGISIKPSQNMQDMKHDMSGAAAVIGLMRAAARLRLPLHVVGIVAAAENLPGGSAYRPGDVITSMAGRTIEILNTDAEGRLVLADALHFARSQFEPDAMIDLATLTGACVIALGRWASGLFGTDDRLCERLARAGEATGERVWRLPLWDEHREHMKSQFADLKNAGGREAGAVTAAAFLSRFAGDTPWAHLDIAGTAWTDKPGLCQPLGATGVGVRLLAEALSQWKGARAS